MIALIPSLEPDSRLARLVAKLRAAGAEVLVVDDGSGPAYAERFREATAAGATVIGYADNRGKGHALREGLRWCQANRPGEVVACADSDGQHAVGDILAAAREAGSNPGALVLGARTTYGAVAKARGVPIKSRVGGRTSALFFRLASGVSVRDTQTGLRAFSPELVPFLLGVEGDRFEYELNALLAAADAGVEIREIPIETIYTNANAGTHFRPLADSARVMRPLLAFGLSGAGSWAFEMALFLALTLRMDAVPAFLAARVASSALNFLVNKHAVFGERSRKRTGGQAIRYGLLAVALAGATAGGLHAFGVAGVPDWLGKTVLDVACVGVSFAVQRRWIFARGHAVGPAGATAGAQTPASEDSSAGTGGTAGASEDRTAFVPRAQAAPATDRLATARAA